MSNEQLDKIKKLVSKINKLQRENDKTLKELVRALELKQFYPDAFKYGSCKICTQGNIVYGIKKATFIITLGNGEKISPPLLKVPKSLWHKDALSAHEAYLKRHPGKRVNHEKRLLL